MYSNNNNLMAGEKRRRRRKKKKKKKKKEEERRKKKEEKEKGRFEHSTVRVSYSMLLLCYDNILFPDWIRKKRIIIKK